MIRKPYIVSLLILLVSCDSRQEIKQQIYQEYLQISYNSNKQICNFDYFSMYDREVGDTVILNPGINLQIFPNDTSKEVSVEPSSLIIQNSTPIRIIWTNGQFNYNRYYHFETFQGDTTLQGLITADEIIENQNGPREVIFEKKNHLRKINKIVQSYKNNITELAGKHNISEDSLLMLLGEQHYLVTGLPFSF